ncbi:hypothetical protein KK120_05625 [Virgibacillus dakarensis]|uniref:hypothetical protein n=1 Tax=Virgibacillus dakarensis TaxID=1917889 RepID=UPI000B42F733|nr:hypothetical protein [Virgibacillus dakarensis]MBT2215304.1 hypothetical protein [Virgibacillus dakarensis]
MSLKKYIIIAILSTVINFSSVFNVAYGVWSIVLLIFSIFAVNNRDSEKIEKDKRLLGFIHTFMLCVIIFISTSMGSIWILSMRYVVYTYLSDFRVLFIVLSILGLIVYYYLIIRLLLEAIAILRQKGGKK